jgi:hypothetical protein
LLNQFQSVKLSLLRISSFLAFAASVFFSSVALSQNVTGEWYGVGKVKKAGDHNSYLSEMILKQKGNQVTGSFNYFYRSVEIKTKITGTYNPKYKVLELNARPILNFLAKNQNGADCPMEGSFTLKIIKGKKTLEGQFNPTYDYRITCPAIDVKFTKSVPPKDELPEREELETSVVPNEPDSVKKPVVTAKSNISIRQLTEQERAELALKQRTFDVTPVIEVDADSLKVSLYDNGEVDNDTISVFVDRQLVRYKQMLSDKPYNFNIPLDTAIKEIAMFAENLGKIPPNTALAIIYAGEQRFELNLTSTYNKNAVIRFRRKIKKADPKNLN